MSRSKRYLEAKKQVERLKEYSLDEAVEPNGGDVDVDVGAGLERCA